MRFSQYKSSETQIWISTEVSNEFGWFLPWKIQHSSFQKLQVWIRECRVIPFVIFLWNHIQLSADGQIVSSSAFERFRQKPGGYWDLPSCTSSCYSGKLESCILRWCQLNPPILWQIFPPSWAVRERKRIYFLSTSCVILRHFGSLFPFEIFIPEENLTHQLTTEIRTPFDWKYFKSFCSSHIVKQLNKRLICTIY